MSKYSYPEIAAFGQTGEATAKTYGPVYVRQYLDSDSDSNTLHNSRTHHTRIFIENALIVQFSEISFFGFGIVRQWVSFNSLLKSTDISFWGGWYRFWDERSYRWGDIMPSNIFWDWFWSASQTFSGWLTFWRNRLTFIHTHIMSLNYSQTEKAVRRMEVREMMSSREITSFD
jgi:hypothetical protein